MCQLYKKYHYDKKLLCNVITKQQFMAFIKNLHQNSSLKFSPSFNELITDHRRRLQYNRPTTDPLLEDQQTEEKVILNVLLLRNQCVN